MAVRLSPSAAEAAEAAKRLSTTMALDTSTKKTVEGSREMAEYVVWGDAATGGLVPESVYERIGQVPGNRTRIRLNDLCAIRHAFVGIVQGTVVCWGDEPSCTGVLDVTEGREDIHVTMAYCPPDGAASIVMLTAPHPTWAGRISIFGDPDHGGRFPQDQPRLTRTLSTIGVNGPVDVVGNTGAICVLFQGGQVFSWGDPQYGGEASTDIEVVFAREIIANDVGFSLLTTTQKIFTWGGSRQTLVPRRIQEGGEALVEKVYGKGECFGALLHGGGVATWGRGEQMFCAEEGAAQSGDFIAYLTVRDQLQSGIVHLVLSESSFAAVTSSNDVVVWGRITHGGSTRGDTNIRWIRPETLVASCCAFAFIRQVRHQSPRCDDY